MSQSSWWVRLQTDYKELRRNYLSQGIGPNLATGPFQEQTCKEKENVFKATPLKWKHGKNPTNVLPGLQFSKGLLINSFFFFFCKGKRFFVAVLCIEALTKQAAERRVCGVIRVPLGIMAGRGNPVLLRATGWGRKTFGAVTAIQLCRRERNTFTCKPMSGITDSVNAGKL